ncbi:MAG: hypothetical protein LJE94_02660 [Deltaproteobacteria bacterium]|nr:hypothetical protein [Deltaproteobacteria bacterium]
MIIQKAGVFRLLRYLGVFCAITMGFFSIVATSEDDVKDALDLEFSENYELSTGEVTVAKPAAVQIAEVVKGCTDSLSVRGVMQNLEDWEDIEKVDIDSIKLDPKKIRVEYRNAWTDPANETFSCTATFEELNPPDTRDAYTFSLPAFDVTFNDSTWKTAVDIDPTDEMMNAINYFLANRAETFKICYECTFDEQTIDDWSVGIRLILPVKITGTP